MRPAYIHTGVMETKESSQTSATAVAAAQGVRRWLKRMGCTVAR